MTDATQQTLARSAAAEPELGDFIRLLKPRVMSLVIFTALAGMAAAPVDVHAVEALVALICIAVGAGAAGALNMWWDADIDAQMSRTRARPVPQGTVAPEEARNLGLGLSILSVMMLGVAANWLAAGLLAFTIFFYAVIYTIWLKRATPQNIVIGGAAGAFPPVVAWAAVTGEVALAPILMFAVIFLWTPPHFWALALWRCRDYRDVSVPMLPVVAGSTETRRQIWLYSLALAPVTLMPALTSAGGPIYSVVALGASAIFLRDARRVALRDEAVADADGYRAEKRLFGFSIVFLFAIFAAFIGDAALRLALQTAGVDYVWPIVLGEGVL
ncbi:MAG: heme o synthase [Pseudomonadota bacterium]